MNFYLFTQKSGNLTFSKEGNDSKEEAILYLDIYRTLCYHWTKSLRAKFLRQLDNLRDLKVV